MIESIQGQVSQLLGGNPFIAPFVALLAGVITAFTPCSLTSIPLIISFVSGTKEKNTKRAFNLSLVFSIGSSISFVILGLLATTAGKLIGSSNPIWYIILGSLMMLMALQTYGIFNFIPSSNLMVKNKKTGFIGAFITGILGGFFSSPCSTPVLVALLAVVSNSNNIWFGIILMLLYGIGHSVLIMVAGTCVSAVQRLNTSEKYKKLSKALNIVLGTLILLIGFYMFYNAF